MKPAAGVGRISEDGVERLGQPAHYFGRLAMVKLNRFGFIVRAGHGFL